jgi:hypothetical protein
VGSEFVVSVFLVMVFLSVFVWPAEGVARPPLRRPREEGTGHPYRRRTSLDP